MRRSFRRTSILWLVAGYVCLSTWLLLLGVSHSLAHGHHTAATHADPLCTWLCSAGQAAASTDVQPITLNELVTYEGRCDTSVALPQFLIPIFSRGPPQDPFSSDVIA